MKLADLKIGMKLGGCQRRFDFSACLRVEFVAYDWAVARTDRGTPVLLDEKDHLEIYNDSEED